jgi:hypothetical protein
MRYPKIHKEEVRVIKKWIVLGGKKYSLSEIIDLLDGLDMDNISLCRGDPLADWCVKNKIATNYGSSVSTANKGKNCDKFYDWIAKQ